MTPIIPGVQIVFRRPAAEAETQRQWLERWEQEKPAEPPPQWITQHFASVRTFQLWKIFHPHDGTMIVLKRHAKWISPLLMYLMAASAGIRLAMHR